jgi:hypothetical protein
VKKKVTKVVAALHFREECSILFPQKVTFYNPDGLYIFFLNQEVMEAADISI